MSAERKNTDIDNELWCRGVEPEDEKSFDEAAIFYLMAAKMGNASAQSNLGNLLDDKVSLPRPDEAVYWYKKAVKNGNSVGAWNLAMHYRNLGDDIQGLRWLQIAARMGDENAQFLLSRLKTIV
jgi:TPR repeat protein